jgi:hypothetical protein
MTEGPQDRLRSALKRAASALKADGVPFALGGSYGLWVHGGPEPDHDVDIVVAEADVERAAEVLAASGFAIERPPEDWLFKARLDGALVDVLHRLNAVPVPVDLVAAAGSYEVLGLPMPVLDATQLTVVRLRSLSEHYCDFAALLPAARAVREQLDWPRVYADTVDNDFAAAFLVLAERLGISPGPGGR